MMRKEQITDKEAICILSIFILGSTLIIGIGGEAKNDAWIAGITGMIMSLPMLAIYARILSLFPGKDLFEILEVTLGKIFGRIFAVIYIWYAFHLGALVIRNFGEFINTVTMTETPIFVPMLCLGLLCIAAVRLGVEELGRFSAFLLPVLLLITLVILVLAIPICHMNNLKPVLGKGLLPVLKGGFAAFAFPFAETVLFMGVLFSLKTQESLYKVYLFPVLFAGTIIVVCTTYNVAILGKILSMLYFPSYVAVARISIGDFLQRIEVTAATVFVVGAFIKSSICLYVAGKGIASLFKLNDYRAIVIQLGLLMIFFSYILYDNIMEMNYWAFKVYAYYAFPMQVILPVIIWIFAEIKKRGSPSKMKNISQRTE